MQNYQRSDFSLLRNSKYGIGFHWTTWTAPKTGQPKSFDTAVNDFDVQANEEWPAPCADSVAAYLQRFIDHGGAVTFNLFCYQDGSAYEPDLQVMREIKAIFR